MFQSLNGQIRQRFITTIAPHRIARRAFALNFLLFELFCEIKRGAIDRSARQVHIGDFWNDISGAVNLYPIANTNILAATDAVAFAIPASNIIFIVQCGIRDHHTANGHRIEARHRA